jgi:hypothetical protein
MTFRRVLTISCVALLALVVAPAAGACELTSVSEQAASGTVRPGDTVTFSIVVKNTDAYPGDAAAYTVVVDGKTVATGTATVNDGGASGTFKVPDLGPSKRPFTIEAFLDNGSHGDGLGLTYDGTPAASSVSELQPAGRPGSQPSVQSGPGASPPDEASAPSVPIANSGAPGGVAKRSHVLTEAVQPAHHATGRQTVARPALGLHHETVALPRGTPVTVAARAAHSAKQRRRMAAPLAVPAGRRFADGPVTLAVPEPVRASEAVRAVPAIVALAVLLFLGVAGAAMRVLRRRSPRTDDDPEALARDLAIEAELQELLAEHHARSVAGREDASKATNSA